MRGGSHVRHSRSCGCLVIIALGARIAFVPWADVPAKRLAQSAPEQRLEIAGAVRDAVTAAAAVVQDVGLLCHITTA